MVTWKKDLEKIPPELNYTKDVMCRWIVQQSGCRRTLIGQVLDQMATSCVLLRDCNPCDNCRAEVSQLHPKTGVGLFQDPEPVALARISHPQLPRTSSSFELLPPRQAESTTTAVAIPREVDVLMR